MNLGYRGGMKQRRERALDMSGMVGATLSLERSGPGAGGPETRGMSGRPGLPVGVLGALGDSTHTPKLLLNLMALTIKNGFPSPLEKQK